MNALKNIVIPFLLLIIGLYLVPISTFEMDFSKIPGDYGDARFNNYILEHGYQYLTGQIDSFWNGRFMYPLENVISLSVNHIGTLPLYSFFRTLNFDRETSFQFWLLSMFILNFCCCYWALSKWVKNPILASSGAYIFAFSLLLVGNIYSAQTLPRFMVPLVFFWTWKYFQSKQIKYLFWLCIGITYQFYAGIYIAFLLIYVLIFFLIAYLIIYRDKELFVQFKKPLVALKSAVIIICSLAVLMLLMWPYIQISKEYGSRSFEEMISTIPTLRSYFFTSKETVLWGFLSNHGIGKLSDYWCHFLFLGGIPWLAILITPVIIFNKKASKESKNMLLFLLLGLALSMFFILNIDGWSAYKLLTKIPGFSSMRSMNRVINTEVMYFILIVIFISQYLTQINSRFKIFIYLLPFLIITDNLIDTNKLVRYDIKDSQKRISTIVSNIKQQNKNNKEVIAYLPSRYLLDNFLHTHIDVMLACQEIGCKSINGYTGSFPLDYDSFYKNMNGITLKKWLNVNSIKESDIAIINGLNLNILGRKSYNFQSAWNKNYICSDLDIQEQLIANRGGAYGWETFEVLELENGDEVLLSSTGRTVGVDKDQYVKAVNESLFDNQKFQIIPLGNDTIAFKSITGKYLGVDNQSLYLLAKSDSIGIKEKFLATELIPGED